MCSCWHGSYYDKKVRRVRDLSCGDTEIYLEVEVRRVACRRCGTVKREQLDWLADNPFYTKRFAFYVGKRCRAGTIKDVARELRLDWHTVKELEKQYMREQLRRVGQPGPKVIGIDEISIRKGHTYRIVVSDLLRMRPIWFGGNDRSEESMGLLVLPGFPGGFSLKIPKSPTRLFAGGGVSPLRVATGGDASSGSKARRRRSPAPFESTAR